MILSTSFGAALYAALVLTPYVSPDEPVENAVPAPLERHNAVSEAVARPGIIDRRIIGGKQHVRVRLNDGTERDLIVGPDAGVRITATEAHKRLPFTPSLDFILTVLGLILKAAEVIMAARDPQLTIPAINPANSAGPLVKPIPSTTQPSTTTCKSAWDDDRPDWVDAG